MRLTTLLLLVLTALPGLPASGLAKKWELADRTYEETIRTVQVYPAGATPLAPAVAGLRAQNLVLEFDDLVSDRASYYARYVHCNYDWTKSILMDLDILDQFNEFPINDFIYSNNESTPYVHYTLRLPPVKLPGNYVLVVYREGDREDVLLTKRFMITDTRATVSLQDNLSGRGTLSTSNQLLNFLVNYRNFEIINPLETVHVVIRQNQRWDNVKNNVQPAFVREDIRQLEYRFFEQDDMFAAGNEFRFVDFRSVNFPGQNTDRLDRKRKPYQLWVAFDRSRESEAYALYRDLNGGYVIQNLDYADGHITGNYLWVTFTFKSPKPLKENVYVVGAFNSWQRTEDNKMTWDAGLGAYQGTVLLKQGVYDYQYVVDGPQPFQLEGSHYQTENMYEILVYYRPFRPNADLLIGYTTLPVNPR